ncbi:MAG: 50S ribosomal protein L6 [Erysipelotrichaceae bacterium]|jgi:large subunit ribosomal protein L6|nr:50S ribosomal protein L6 [Erysipelotrichaceae bacterium]MBQ1347033.1 50S ribosomal protein L6 [Erysipelotrichaceae bacterium]MBQ1380024.1 50S ribosomal protein L6 [Erysipelotrichaceae bacterium]MBQ1775728.1 50S ribosomal protein L6 [Erysipelotrichaceae bacterium]MBQ2078668.1 50S ribosomal protein L6 [Erysipelotrichaceae bacterium]
MSRIGNKTITIPAGCEISVSDSNEVTVKGPKGTLSRQFNPNIGIKVEDGQVTCTRANENKQTKQLHGTTRALIHNMIVGTTEGFKKTLEIVGIGYRAALNGKTLNLNIGYSHEINYPIEDGITIEVPNATTIVVSGIDKQRVGEVAAHIRNFRKPEPYKGKGIRYQGEHIIHKEGKTAAA